MGLLYARLIEFFWGMFIYSSVFRTAVQFYPRVAHYIVVFIHVFPYRVFKYVFP